jgi:hypothetical protein
MAKCTHDAVITTGEYTDRESGETKKRYQKIGVVFTNEKGQMSMKLDALPCGPNWSGFISLYEKDNDQPQPRQQQPAQPQGNQHQAAGHPLPQRTDTQLQDVRQPQGAGNGPNNETEDIPFNCFDRNGIY